MNVFASRAPEQASLQLEADKANFGSTSVCVVAANCMVILQVHGVRARSCDVVLGVGAAAAVHAGHLNLDHSS